MNAKFLLLLAFAGALFGDDSPAGSKDTPDTPSQSLWDYHPIHVGGNLIALGSADITDTPAGGNLTFRKANAFLYMLLPVSATSYFFPRVEWNAFTMNWDHNPKFNQTNFYYMQFALTFYTIAIEKWRWILRANYNLDIKHMNRPSDYGLFEMLVWGAYQPHRKWHYHIGAFGYTGMAGAQVYPVLGADYSPNKHWTFLAVFPIDYHVQYKLDDHWRFALKARPLKERFRTGQNQPQPRSVFSYSSTGAELNVHYERHMRFEIEAYGGYNFGGSFYVKDSRGKNALYTTVGGALYGGVNVDYAF